MINIMYDGLFFFYAVSTQNLYDSFLAAYDVKNTMMNIMSLVFLYVVSTQNLLRIIYPTWGSLGRMG